MRYILVFLTFFYSSLLLAQPSVTFDPTSIAVTATTADDISENLTITNVGDSDLTWSVEASGDVHYSLSAAEGTVSAGASTTLVLTEAAADHPDGGTYESELRFITNDPSNAITDIPVTITLTGTPVMSVSVTSIDFGEVISLTSDTVSFTISNSGDDDLTLSGATTVDEFSLLETSATLSPATSYEMQVVFNPLTAGTYTDNITLTTNDPAAATLAIPLTAIGLDPPDIDVSVTSLSSSVTTGATDDQTFTISNSGGSNLEFGFNVEYLDINPTITFTKEDYADWTLEENQDRITDEIWITRRDNQGLINYFSETSFDRSLSPEGTEWHWGPATNEGNYSWEEWDAAVEQSGYNTRYALSQEYLYAGTPLMTMHIVGTDLYYEILFTSWTGGNQGGGFSYERTQVDEDGLHGISGYVSLTQTGAELTAVDFTKEDYADWTLEENQDRITDEIWITRRDNQGLINYFSETSFDRSLSPEGTEWHWGPATNEGNYSWEEWDAAVEQSGYNTRYALSQEYLYAGTPLMTMHIVGTDLYYEILFTSWTGGNQGGGFSYVRTRIDPNTGEQHLAYSLVAGGTAEVTATFDPGSIYTGDYSAKLNIPNNDPTDTTQVVDLSVAVTGVPNISFEESYVQFEETVVGLSNSYVMTIENDGTGDLEITSITTTDESFTLFWADDSSDVSNTVIHPGEERDVLLTFSPTVDGSFSASMTITSNDPDQGSLVIGLIGTALPAPVLSVAPETYDFGTIEPGDTLTTDFVFANTGGSDLDWSANLSIYESVVLARSPEFGTGSLTNDLNDVKVETEIVAPAIPPEINNLFSFDPTQFDESSNNDNHSSRNTDLDEILENLNENYESVNSLIPNRFDFDDGESSYYIPDGGADMYDGGNYLNTNLGGYIEYSNDMISTSQYLGDGQYFTRKYDGLFVFAADINVSGNDISQFYISGDLGADGSGSADGSVLEVDINGITFHGFVKRVYGGYDPSVNHLILVKASDDLSHSFDTYTNNDYHEVSGLEETTRIYYLLYAGNETDQGYYIDDDATMSIAEAFLNAAGVQGGVIPGSGTIEALGSETVSVTILTENALFGDNVVDLVIESNDPLNSPTLVPMTFYVEPPVMTVDPLLIEYGSVNYNDTLVSELTIENSGGADLEWEAFLYEDESRNTSSSMTYDDLRMQFATQLMPRQLETDEIRAEIQSKLGTLPERRPQEDQTDNGSQSVLRSGDYILPPQAHRNRNGSVKILMLADNNYYGWNTMDALASYFDSDYDLMDVYTDWDHNNLQDEIESYGPNLVFVPYGHWLDAYDDYDGMQQVLSGFVESGGGLLFTGSNYQDFGGTMENSWLYGSSCCGYWWDDGYYDAEHPIMEGVDDGVDIYEFITTYVPSDSDIEVVFNIQNWWGYDYDHVNVSKQYGNGRVTVLGSTFYGWYDDEAIMLANAVDYTTGSGGIGSGIIEPYSSETISVTTVASNYGPGDNGLSLVIESNDPENDSLVVPITFSIDPPELTLSTESAALELYVNEVGDEEIVTLTNTGSYPLDWFAELEMNSDDARNLSNLLDPRTFRAQWSEQMIPRQMETEEIRSEIERKLAASGAIPAENHNNTTMSDAALLSGNKILPPEAHRTRTGSTNIIMLMDNEYYAWNTMDALSIYYTDYNLTDIYTDWDHNILESEIDGADLVIVPFGHWLDNYYDWDGMQQVLSDFVESGGGLLITGYNFAELGGFFEGSYAYSGWCCNYGWDEYYYDEDHPIMAGVDGYVDLYYWTTHHLESDNDVEVVFHVDGWPGYGYDNEYVTFSKAVGSGRVTVLGSAFEGWYDDEAIMLSNSVEYTAGSGGFGIDVTSGTISPESSMSINLLYSTFGMVGEYSGSLMIASNDPDNEAVDLPVSINVMGAPDITGNVDHVDFGELIVTDTASFMIEIGNNGTETLDISSLAVEPLGNNIGAFNVTDLTASLEPGEFMDVEIHFTPTVVGPDSATLIITSNDPNESSFHVSMSGDALPAPVMTISEESITVDIVSFTTEETQFLVSNLGDGLLDYSLDVTSVEGAQDVVTFVKEDYADWTLEENQDRLSETVWLTRQDNQGLFNAYSQGNYEWDGPWGTSWRWGATLDENYAGYGYTTWSSAVEQSGYNVNETLVQQIAGTPVLSVYLYDTDEYYDITFLSFTGNNNGGGFSWERQRVDTNNDLSWLDVSVSGPGAGSEPVYFQKENYADYWLEENQDQITDNVWITRENQHGLFNAATQNGWDWDYSGPEGTEWHWGPTSDDTWYYTSWRDAVYQSPCGGAGDALNGGCNGDPSTMSLHLIEEDLYFDVTFEWWQCCSDGGGFAYTRVQVDEFGNSAGGFLEPGMSDTVFVNMDPGFLPEGTYAADLNFTTNDPQNRHPVVPVTMNLTGIPQFYMWPDTLEHDFNQVYIDQEGWYDLWIYNGGTGLLTVDAAVEGEYYTVEPSALEILPDEWVWMTVRYTPLSEGVHTGSLVLNTNDENNASISVAFTGEGLIAPVVVVSPDTIGVYVPEQDSRSRTFQVSNTGGSDLHWYVESAVVDANDMRNGASETVTEFRSRWANQMIPAQEKTAAVEQEINQKLQDNENNTVQIKSSVQTQNSGKPAGNTTNGRGSGSNTSVASPPTQSVKGNSRPAEIENMGSTREILPPEAHRSRDGNTMITVLMDNEYTAWNTLDALSWYYSNYSIDVIWTGWRGDSLQGYLDTSGTDVLLVPFGHWVYNYENNWPYVSFIDGIADFLSQGGQVLYTGYNDWSWESGFGYGFGYAGYCCWDYWYNDENNWNENHPVMSGIDYEFYYYEIITSYLDPTDDDNQGVESIMNFNPEYDYDGNHAIFSKNVGAGNIVVVGSTFFGWTDDEARVLSNAIQYLGGANDFVSFEPTSGTLGVGESMDVVATFSSEGLVKGEYTSVSTLLSNDIYNSNVPLVHTMRVVGTPTMESEFLSNDGVTLNFGEVPLMYASHDYMEIMNYDSNTITISSVLEYDDPMFEILEGGSMELLPFESDTLVLAANAGMNEGWYGNQLLMTSSHPEMESHTISLYAQIVPQVAPIITDISDVHPDQGGWVTLEFTRSYYDGWFGNQRTEMYTVQLWDDGDWIATNSTVAYQDARYVALAHTLQDSGVLGDGMTEFRVIAGMDEGTWSSNSEFGYSTDDLAPGAPISLAAEQSGNHIALNWEHGDDDYYHFSIYRHTNPDFEPGPDNHIGDAMEMSFMDTTAEWFVTQYYAVTALDYGGNVSDPSDVAEGYVHVNFAPEMNAIDPQAMDEDQSLELVVSASDQNEDDVLTYAASSSTEDVVVTVSNDTLSVALTENWFGTAEILVSVTDSEFADTTGFTLTVNAVNDAPGAFTLVGPADSSVIMITPNEIAQGTMLHINWLSSFDVDNDDVSYGFVLYGGPYSLETPALIDTIVSDTAVHISYENLAMALGYLGESIVSGDWTVFATDGEDTTMSDEIWTITLDATGVLSVDGELIPREFALHQNYPNPFNPTTTLRYDLPQDTKVLITIYDIRGRAVRTLVNDYQDAGYRLIHWNATNDYGQPVSAGMYIYTIQAGDFRQVKKMILLK